MKTETQTENYHGEKVTFEVGQTVIHVTDSGETFLGTVISIDGGLLNIDFEDGDEGWEYANTCY